MILDNVSSWSYIVWCVRLRRMLHPLNPIRGEHRKQERPYQRSVGKSTLSGQNIRVDDLSFFPLVNFRNYQKVPLYGSIHMYTHLNKSVIAGVTCEKFNTLMSVNFGVFNTHTWIMNSLRHVVLREWPEIRKSLIKYFTFTLMNNFHFELLLQVAFQSIIFSPITDVTSLK